MIAQFTAQERHGHGEWIGKPCRFKNDVIERFRSVQHPFDRFHQFIVDRATDAAIAEFHHLLTGGHNQIVVDADLAEFIHQHRRFDAALAVENVVQQCGFSSSKETGQDSDRNPCRGWADGHGGVS